MYSLVTIIPEENHASLQTVVAGTLPSTEENGNMSRMLEYLCGFFFVVVFF